MAGIDAIKGNWLWLWLTSKSKTNINLSDAGYTSCSSLTYIQTIRTSDDVSESTEVTFRRADNSGVSEGERVHQC
jgi:hypothetical protein